MRTPAPFEGESPRAYLSRLSDANGYSSCGLIALLRERSILQVTAGWDYSKLQPALGPLCPLPSAFGYRVPGKQMREKAQINCVPIQSRHLGLTKARVCPHCLDELGYVPVSWDLKSFIACPTHGCWMLKHCGECGKRLKYLRPGVSTCSCGADIRRASTAPAALHVVGFCEILHAMVTKDTSRILQARLVGMPVENLLTMDLDVFVRVAVTIANVFQAISEWRPTPRPYSQLVDAIPDAAEVLTDWPLRFESLCARWHENPSMRSRDDGFQSRFSWLFVRLHKNLKSRSAQTTFMLEAACSYGTRRWENRPIRIKNKHLSPMELPEPRFGSANDAARILRIDPITAARWAAKGRFPATHSGKNSSRNWCIDLDAVRSIRVSRLGSIQKGEIAKEFGASLPAMTQMLASGLIESTFMTGAKNALAREDFQRVRDNLLHRCEVPPREIDLIPLRDALIRNPLTRQHVIVKGILEGTIKSYGNGVEHVHDILVERPLKPPKLEKPVPAPKPLTHCSTQIAVKRYELNTYESRAIFIKLGCGLFRGSTIGLGRGGGSGLEHVEIRRLERFMERHKLVRKIADKFGLYSLQLIRAIRRRRPKALLALSQPLEGGVCAFFVKKQDVPYIEGVARQIKKRNSNNPR